MEISLDCFSLLSFQSQAAIIYGLSAQRNKAQKMLTCVMCNEVCCCPFGGTWIWNCFDNPLGRFMTRPVALHQKREECVEWRCCRLVHESGKWLLLRSDCNFIVFSSFINFKFHWKNSKIAQINSPIVCLRVLWVRKVTETMTISCYCV